MYKKDIYDDMLSLPHHVSDTHPQMPLSKRAAQFAPFAALDLSGYEATATPADTQAPHGASGSSTSQASS